MHKGPEFDHHGACRWLNTICRHNTNHKIRHLSFQIFLAVVIPIFVLVSGLRHAKWATVSREFWRYFECQKTPFCFSVGRVQFREMRGRSPCSCRFANEQHGGALRTHVSRYRFTTIKVLWILCLVHQQTQIKVYFKVKLQERWRFVGCLTVVIQIRRWRFIACIVMVTPWRLCAMQSNECHPLGLKPNGYVQKYQTQLYICRSATYLYQGSLMCVCVHKNPN